MVTIKNSGGLKIESGADESFLSCEFNSVPRANSSVMLSQGASNKVIVTYDDSLDVNLFNLRTDRATLKLMVRLNQGKLTAQDRLLESHMKPLLEKVIRLQNYPQSAIQITWQEIEDGGSLMEAFINGTCLALIKAAAEIQYSFAAVTVTLIDSQTMRLNANRVEIDAAQAVLLFVFDSIDFGVIFERHVGRFSHNEILLARLLAQTKAELIFRFYRKVSESPGLPVKMVMIVRTDLNMSSGKVAAQCSHAAVTLHRLSLEKHNPHLKHWLQSGQPKIVLRTNLESNLRNLFDQCQKCNLNACMIFDAGKTELDACTLTVLGIGPNIADEIDKLTRDYKLL